MSFGARSILLGSAALYAVSAAGQDGGSADQIQRGPVPAWANPSELLPAPADASGLAFVRAQDNVIHLDSEGEKNFVAYRIRLLHPQALEFGNIAIAWNPAVGTPTIHALRIHRDGETIDVMGTAKFEVLRREDQLEAAMLSGVLTAVTRVPDLRVGDELEFAYTIPSGDPTLGAQSAGAMMLAGTTLPGRYHLGISWAPDQQPKIRATDDFGAPAVRSANAFDIRVDNPPAAVPPKDAPPRYQWQRVVEYTDFASWPALSKRFAPLFAEAARMDDGSPLKAEAARIAAAHPDPAGRAQAALALVQEQVRYVYVGLDGGNYRPASAEETWRRRYGDCKGKTALLLALLGELGVPAQAVLVSNAGTDDGIDTRLPTPAGFDHVLVRAQIGGKTHWLDGTLPAVVEMRTLPIVPYRWVLPLSPQGSAIEKVAHLPPALPDDMGIYEIDAREGFDRPARKVHTSVKRGIDGVGEYLQLSALTPDQLKLGFRNAFAGNGEWDEVEDVVYRYDRKTQASLLTIAGRGPVDWDDRGGGEYQLVLPGGGFSPPNRRQRPSDQDQSAPYYNKPGFSCYATTVRLPEGTDLDHWGFNSVFDTMIYGRIYYRMMEKRDDRTIRLVRGSRVEQQEIGAEAARRDNGRLDRFDNSKANITYDPATAMEPWGRLHPVPATYEFDWAGSSPPCLPKDILTP